MNIECYKQDDRPKRYGWAPGGYANKCPICGDHFIGDKRASMCADCAYSFKSPEEQMDLFD